MAAPIRAFRVDSVEQHGRRRARPPARPATIKVYPDAPHGFNADYRPSYRPEAAKDGWARMLAWFKEYGVG